ncbi:MAG: enoyl-CoA hydratase/isomerase family protein [Chloroflexi bacterium]|nr:enoyl-CoA hydratase/isomerase family protein [Chloroflexota bacterium]MBU1747212.1 enoyl-CoA hydratase/isomerase family protein [Chloroflexota bacterium]
MGFQHITFEKRDGVARLALNKPPLNVLDIAMMREINSVLEGLNDDAAHGPTVKVLVFEAAEGSKAFSAGVDVSEHTADKVKEMIEVFHRIFRLMDGLEVPTVAVVGGAALGGGCELALFCDMIIASERASFGQPEIQVGVFPPLAAVALPGIVGPKKALEMVLIGDRIRAAEAAQLGLVNKVVQPEELQAAADEFVGKLAKLSGAVLRLTKRAVRVGSGVPFAEGLAAVEELYLGPLMSTEDANEGLAAFLEKRVPVWKDK